MTLKILCPPRRASRAKLGSAILAAILLILGTAQVSASPSGGPGTAIHGATP